jgi:chromatin segregation and condensation protein Rec8/ScpA/Scc1 (kleisin family)
MKKKLAQPSKTREQALADGTGGNHVEDQMIRGLDQLAEFERFQQEVSPALREDIRKGLAAGEIYQKYASIAAARGVTIAMTERDTSKAIRAVQDILDRTAGRAVQKVEAKHKFDELTEEQLDALLKTRLRKEGLVIDVTPDEGDEDDGT